MKLKTLFLVMCGLFLAGCGVDNYEEVPQKTEGVLFSRPYAAFNRIEGVELKMEPLLPGKRNHGAGPSVRYDYNMAIIEHKLAMDVKMRDNINMPFTITVTWQMIPGKSIDAALNFMPTSSLTNETGKERLEISALNSIQIAKVPMREMFARNAAASLEMAAQDQIDDLWCKEVQAEQLGEKIKAQFLELMQQKRIPRTVYANGKFSCAFPGKEGLTPANSIAFIDLIQVFKVSVEYKNPEPLQLAIRDIENMRALIIQEREQLQQITIERENRIAKAKSLVTLSNTIREALHKYPWMRAYQKLNKLQEATEKGNNHGTRVYVGSPESLSRLQITEAGKVAGVATANTTAAATSAP